MSFPLGSYSTYYLPNEMQRTERLEGVSWNFMLDRMKEEVEESEEFCLRQVNAQGFVQEGVT